MGIRWLAKLLHMESEVLSATGDPAGAMSSLLDAVHLGSDLPRGGLIIDALVSRAVEAIGVSHAWEIIDRLDADSARALARRAEDIYRRHWPFAETIEDERRLQHRELLEYLLGSLWKYVIAGVYSTHQGGWSAFIGTLMRLLPASRESLLADHKRYMDAEVALARMPFSKAVQQQEARGKLVRYYMSFGARSQARVHVDNGATQKAFLAVALALRAYQLDHGEYPSDLSDLVPDYLGAVPNDPFAADAPLRYRIDGDRYILHSIGPDGVDDGGTAIFDPDNPFGPWSQHQAHANSRGDIVAGVNR